MIKKVINGVTCVDRSFFRSDEDYSKALLCNKISFLLILLSVPYLIAFLFLGLSGPCTMALLLILIYATSILLVKKKVVFYGKILTFFASNLAVAYFYIFLGEKSGIHVAFFGLSCMPVLLSEGREKISTLLPLFSVALFFIVKWFQSSILVSSFFTHSISINQYCLDIIYIGATIATFSIIIFSVKFFRLSLESVNERLAKKNNLLLEQKKKLKVVDAGKLVQDLMLQSFFPSFSTLKPSVFYRANMSVSGDYYFLHKVSENSLICFIADCAGKGVPATLNFVLLYRIFKDLMDQTSEQEWKNPEKMITLLQELLFRERAFKKQLPGFYAFVDGDKKEIHYINAGMEALCLIRNHKGIQFPVDSPPLRRDISDVFVNQFITFETNDIICLFTDCLTSKLKHKPCFIPGVGDTLEYDLSLLIQSLESRPNISDFEIASRIADEFIKYVDDVSLLPDDITILTIKIV